MDDNIRHLRDLLAVIHRDGGHHTEKVGLEQSVEDAYTVVHAGFQAAENLELLETMLRTRVASS